MIVTPDGLAFDDGTLLTSTDLIALDALIANAAMLTAVTASAAEINKLAGLATTALELGKLSLAPFLVTMTSTPASGSCAVQFTVKNAAGVAVAVPVAGQAYLCSDSAGLTPVAAATSIAKLTNGNINIADATPSVGPWFNYVTTAAGLLGITVTTAAATVYVAFVLPNGKIVVSGAIVIN